MNDDAQREHMERRLARVCTCGHPSALHRGKPLRPCADRSCGCSHFIAAPGQNVGGAVP